jgi:hypothetical protein
MRSAMEPVPIRPWALCIRAQPYSKSLERGGIWIWIIILLLATAAAAGGVFYRDQTLAKKGQGRFAEAESHYKQGQFKKAEVAYVEALESLTAVGPWTPLNKEAADTEEKAYIGLLRSHIQTVSKSDPILAERLLAELKESSQGGKEAGLEELIDERFSVELLLGLERGGYQKLDQVWQQIQSGNSSSATLKELSQNGRQRGRLRTYVATLVELLTIKKWEKVEAHRISGPDILSQSKDVFKGFEKEYASLEKKNKRAIEIHESWKGLNKLSGTIRGWAGRLMSKPRFLGDFHKNLYYKNCEFPTLVEGDSEGFETVIKGFAETRASLVRLYNEFKRLADIYRGMSLIDTSPTEKNLSLLFMDRYEVTRQQFKDFIVKSKGYDNSNGYDKRMQDIWDSKGWESIIEIRACTMPEGWDDGGNELHPVSGVSFWEARAFAATVNKQIPTKDQWMKALVGNDYPWGSSWSGGKANMARDGKPGSLVEVGSIKVGQTQSGIADLFGNVREWAYVEQTDPEDPFIGWLMGGSFETEVAIAKSNDRSVLYEGSVRKSGQERNMGIRLTKVLVWDPYKKVEVK